MSAPAPVVSSSSAPKPGVTSEAHGLPSLTQGLLLSCHLWGERKGQVSPRFAQLVGDWVGQDYNNTLMTDPFNSSQGSEAA